MDELPDQYTIYHPHHMGVRSKAVDYEERAKSLPLNIKPVKTFKLQRLAEPFMIDSRHDVRA